jgi:hypothetical protein
MHSYTHVTSRPCDLKSLRLRTPGFVLLQCAWLLTACSGLKYGENASSAESTDSALAHVNTQHATNAHSATVGSAHGDAAAGQNGDPSSAAESVPVTADAQLEAAMLGGSAYETDTSAGTPNETAHSGRPTELSDEASLQRLTDIRSLPLLRDNPDVYVQQSSYERRPSTSLLLPLSGNGNRDYNNFICASIDAILPPQVAPFTFDQPFCAEQYVHGVMLGRFEGAGRLVRVWLGALSMLNAPADVEVLRIYVDDDPKPYLDLPLHDIMTGYGGEMFAPPFGAGSAGRLAWYYPVAFNHKLIVALDNLGSLDEYWFHTDAVMSRNEHAAVALDTETRLHERDAAKEFLSQDKPGGPHDTLHGEQPLTLAASESQAIQVEGPATTYQWKLRYLEADAQKLENVQVQVTWDKANHPAIALPLLELFAASPTPPELSNLWLSSARDGRYRVLTFGLPAPFAKQANFGFENTGEAAVEFEWSVFGEAGDLDDVGRLHVERRQTDAPVKDPVHVALETEGRGRLVGLCGYWQGHSDPSASVLISPLNLLEGDVNAFVDGKPALRGTGTEEYTDDVFYFAEAPHARPFEQAWGVTAEKNPGKASFCRWHVLGTELDYIHAFKLQFELGAAGNVDIVEKIRTIAYYYQRD